VTEVVLGLRDVSVRRDGRTILGPLDWSVRAGERWVILGPNGAGKTTLLEVAATALWPTTGSVTVLGGRVGSFDARTVRGRIGYAGSAVDTALEPRMTALETVVTGRHGDLAPWWHAAAPDDLVRAHELLARVGMAMLAHHPISTLSTGERRRVLVARALLSDPALLLLDEPTANLDLAAREDLLAALESLAEDAGLPAIVLVSHHVEEIPPGFRHALLLRDGVAVAAGPVRTALTSASLSAAYGRPLRLARVDGRYLARRTEPAP
jgi:iron complex transport system ATP-binding protein